MSRETLATLIIAAVFAMALGEIGTKGIANTAARSLQVTK